MDFFRTNVKLLKSIYPNLLPIVNEDASFEPTYEVMLTHNGEPNMALFIEGQKYYIHSRYNAIAEAKKWVSTIQEEVHSGHVFILGIGLGYFLEALIELPEVEQVYICEPSVQIFNQMIRVRDIKPLLSNPKVKIMAVGEDELFLKQVADQIATYLSSENLSILAPSIYKRIYKEKIELINSYIKESLVGQVANFHTYHTFQDIWLTNILNNLPYTILHPSFHKLKNLVNGGKAIVIGSGPSLSLDVEYLKLLRNKCIIIAAGSSIQALEHHNIYPDLVVSMDGGIANLHVFKNLKSTSTPLLFVTQIYYEILDIYKGEKYYSTFNNDLISKYLYSDSETVSLLNTATVTGTAIQAAQFMGFNEIILMGQDLSYPGKQYYTSGVKHISDKELVEITDDADLWIENVYGGQNPTTKKMMFTLRDLELLIKIQTQNGLKVINTSQKGAVIKYTEYRTMESMMGELLNLENQNFNLLEKNFQPSLHERHETFSHVISKLKFILKQTEDVDNKLDNLIKTINSLKHDYSKHKFSALNQKLQTINKLWTWITTKETFTIFYTFSRGHHINIYVRYVPIIVETRDIIKKAKLIEEHLGNLTVNIKQFVPELQSILRKAIQRLNEFVANHEGIK